jgi:G3E family GTPase
LAENPQPKMHNSPIPVTVVSGSLGAGKTTLILSMLKQLPADYPTVWLKNEYGDVNIDSELGKESNLITREILNGCVCCVLVGKLHDALVEIATTINPRRIIVETAGTAYPYPIVAEISKIPQIKLDGLITVVDALNLKRFSDKSPLAKAQARYVDLVVINKIKASGVDLDTVMDEVYELYLDSPKINTVDGTVNINLLLGLDPILAKDKAYSDLGAEFLRAGIDLEHPHLDSVDVFSFVYNDKVFDLEKITSFLKSLPSSDYYRIKGIIKTATGYFLLNYVSGKIDWQELEGYKGQSKITVMGKGIKNLGAKFESQLH